MLQNLLREWLPALSVSWYSMDSTMFVITSTILQE